MERKTSSPIQSYFKKKKFTGVQFPISEKLCLEDIYDRRTGKPRAEVLKEHFFKEGRIQEEVLFLLNSS